MFRLKLANKKPKSIELPKQVIEVATESQTETASSTDQSTDTSSQQVLNKAQTEMLDKMLKCMNTLIEIATQSNRNIILDQVSLLI